MCPWLAKGSDSCFGAPLHSNIEGEHPMWPRHQVRGTLRTWYPGTHLRAEKVLTVLGQAGLRGEMCLQKRPHPTATIRCSTRHPGKGDLQIHSSKGAAKLVHGSTMAPDFCTHKLLLPYPFCTTVFIPISAHHLSPPQKLLPYAASLSPRARRLPSAQSKHSSKSLPGCC